MSNFLIIDQHHVIHQDIANSALPISMARLQVEKPCISITFSKIS
jgi:hypothetical protein